MNDKEIVTLELTRKEVMYLVANMSVASDVAHMQKPDVEKLIFTAAGCEEFGIPIADKFARALGMTVEEYHYD